MQITCPECETVLKPAKPIAVGKRVKCPKCNTTFTVEEEEAPSAKIKAGPAPAAIKNKTAGAPKPAKKPEAPTQASESDDDEGGTYGVASGNEEKHEDKDAPKIDYAPDTSIKDLRGPAQAAVIQPTNQMILIGVVGFIGWLALLIIFCVPVLFPIETEEGTKDAPKVVLKIGRGFGQIGDESTPQPPAGKKEGEAKANVSLYMFMGMDFAQVSLYAWYMFIIIMTPLFFGMAYAAVQTYGIVRAQNLESRNWGIASSIMGMLPITVGGFAMVICMGINFLMNMVIDDADTITYMIIGVASIIGLLQIGAAVYTLLVLMREDVIAGFAFVPDIDDVKADKKGKARRKKKGMKATYPRVLSLGLLSVAVVVMGCKPPPSKIQFNDRMAEANTRLSDAAGNYRKALFPSGGQLKDFDPSKVNVSSLKTAFSDMESALSSVRSDYEDPDLPRRSSTASGLKEAYQKYLEQEEKILAKAGEIVKSMENKELANTDKYSKVLSLLSEMKDLEDKSIVEVDKAQKSYADQHNFKMVTKRD